MTLGSMESNREADIRVVGEIGSQARLYTYGVAFRDEQLDFWQEEFSPLPAEQLAPKPLALEFSACHAPITIEHGDFEFDVCTIQGGLVRYCDECAFATVWKFPAISSTADTAAAESKASNFTPSKPTHLIEPVQSAVAVMEGPSIHSPEANVIVLESLADTLHSLPTERRPHGRAKVNYYACIRSEAFGDDCGLSRHVAWRTELQDTEGVSAAHRRAGGGSLFAGIPGGVGDLCSRQDCQPQQTSWHGLLPVLGGILPEQMLKPPRAAS